MLRTNRKYGIMLIACLTDVLQMQHIVASAKQRTAETKTLRKKNGHTGYRAGRHRNADGRTVARGGTRLLGQTEEKDKRILYVQCSGAQSSRVGIGPYSRNYYDFRYL